MKTPSILLLSTLSLLLAGCSTTMESKIAEDARYWQRKDTTDAIYQQGPKAQQMLFQDIAKCTSDVNELFRLNAVRKAVPPDNFDQNQGMIDLDTAGNRLSKWATPERSGYMRTELYDYTDFEGCMTFKGWERVKNVDYKTVNRARDTYLETIGVERYRNNTGERAKTHEYNK